MEIPKKFEMNVDDFKIFFDNDKKTHVCENLQTGEKTNIGFFGILLQMGIIRAVDDKNEASIRNIAEKLERLENKIEDLTRRISGTPSQPEPEEVEEIPEEPEEVQKVEEPPKSDIKERIMENVLKHSEQAEKPTQKVSEPVGEVKEKVDPNVVVESDEEIENWEEI